MPSSYARVVIPGKNNIIKLWGHKMGMCQFCSKSRHKIDSKIGVTLDYAIEVGSLSNLLRNTLVK